MDDNVATSFSADDRQDILKQVRTATPLQLMTLAASLADQDDDTLSDWIASGWIRLFFAEWQAQLKRFVNQFSLPKNDDKVIRIVRGDSASELHSELETLQLYTGRKGGYYVDDTAGILNIQLSFPSSYIMPFYQIALSDIHGYLIDNCGDLLVDITDVRDIANPLISAEDKPTALLYARQSSALLQQAFGDSCLPQSLTEDALRDQLTAIEQVRDQYAVLMDEAVDVLPMALWRIDVDVTIGEGSQTYHFFAFPSDERRQLLTVDDKQLVITSFSGVAGVFNVGDVEGYTVTDAVSGDTVDYVTFSTQLCE